MKKIIPLVTALCVTAAMPVMANEKMHSSDYNLQRDYFSQMDINHDGVISREEHDIFADRIFNMADTNHDGMLTRDELRAFKHRKFASNAKGGYGYTAQGSPYQNREESTGGIAGNDLQPSAGHPQYPSGKSEYPTARNDPSDVTYYDYDGRSRDRY